MKKIINNSKIGNLTILGNLLVFLFLIISMVQLMRFDKINIQYVEAGPAHEKALDALRVAEQPTKKDSITVAHYQYRVDTLKAKPIPTDKKAAKALADELERVSGVLKEHQATKHHNDSIVKVREAEYAPIAASYEQLEQATATAQTRFNVFYRLTFILLIAKIVLFAFWSYKNMHNIRANAVWAKKASSPIWAFVGWVIPIYNMIKPYSVTGELFNDTEYLLKEKGIVSEDYDRDDYNDFYIGMWWGFYLLAIGLGVLFINGTFFETGVLFQKLKHFDVMFCVTVLWAIYLFLESLVVFRYNKMNQLLVDNQGK